MELSISSAQYASNLHKLTMEELNTSLADIFIGNGYIETEQSLFPVFFKSGSDMIDVVRVDQNILFHNPGQRFIIIALNDLYCLRQSDLRIRYDCTEQYGMCRSAGFAFHPHNTKTDQSGFGLHSSCIVTMNHCTCVIAFRTLKKLWI